MPFLRTPNGSKLNFSLARLSALLSLVYQEAYGEKTPKFRAAIQKHSISIWEEIGDIYGKDPDSEWPGQGIYTHIEEELRLHANTIVHETFLSMRINEFQEASRDKKPKSYDRFEAEIERKTSKPSLPSHEHVDPIWAVIYSQPSKNSGPDNLGPRSSETEENHIHENEQPTQDPTKHDLTKNDNTPRPSFQSLSERMGVAIKAKSALKPKALDIVASRRSTWIQFWKILAKDLPVWQTWERHILNLGLDQKHLTPDEWWDFWQDNIDICLSKDPRVHELRRVMYDRQKRGLLSGQHWLSGTDLCAEETPLKLEQNPTGNVWYKRGAVEHLKSLFPQKEWQWTEISKNLKPERDQNFNWRAWQNLDDSHGLWPIIMTWPTGEQAAAFATEMPQWAIMRMAMAMALIANDQTHQTQNALELYEQISQKHLIPSASVWREAGKKDPRFFEDSAWWVDDNFNGIQKAVYATAVDTVWTGTVASSWNRVRSKNAPVKEGRRKSTGVNDFLKIINAHMLAQGRVGEERPVTPILPCWHRDIEEFLSLRHEEGGRLQPVISISDLFMQRLAENGHWNLFDPYVYPEVLEKDGYAKAEELITLRKKMHPKAHKTLSAEKMWKKMLGLCRVGSPYIVFEGSDEAYSMAPGRSLSHGLDGVGVFPIFSPHHTQNISWPSMAVNISAMMSAEGEPLLDQWRETLTWAFWMAEQMYTACQDDLSEETLSLRPLCLGAVGFYEAVRKASIGGGANDEEIDVWVDKISEAWGALVSVIDQVFCQKNGPAPIWETEGNLQTFHPKVHHAKLKSGRGGGGGVPAPPQQISEIYEEISAHRFSVRTVWAPFKQLASWAGVSPGGFGTLFPLEWVLDEKRKWRLTPTNFLLDTLEANKNPQELGVIFDYPENPQKWPTFIRKLAVPDMEEWNRRLKHAASVRIWIDQGVSLTLPSGISPGNLSILLQKAWWSGVSNVRFEDGLRRPQNIEDNTST